jgi:hypothetical protein
MKRRDVASNRSLPLMSSFSRSAALLKVQLNADCGALA